MKLFYFFVLIFYFLKFTDSKLAPNVLISDENKQRFKSYFDLNQVIKSENLPNLYYSLVGLNVLHHENLNVAFSRTSDKTDFCQKLNKFISIKKNLNLDNLFYSTSSLKILDCQVLKSEISNINNYLESQSIPDISVPNLYKYGFVLENIGKKINSIRIFKALTNALKNNDSFLSLGYSLQLSSKFTGNELNTFFKKIPDVVSQADEVNERFLQFEGGLAVTVSIFNGILKLSSSANKSALTNEQVVKFTNYFLNRITVTNAKGAAELLEVLKQLSNNKFHVPIVVTNYGKNFINQENPSLVVKITNVLGESLNEDLSISVILEDNKKVLNQVQGDSSLFAIDLYNQVPKLKAGKYVLKVLVESKKLSSHLVIVNDIELNLYAQTKVNLDNIEFSVMEKDQLTSIYEKIDLKKKLDKLYKINNNQKLSLRFTVKDLVESNNISPQQVYIYFKNKDTKDVIFVADQDKVSKLYKLDVNLAFKSREFNFVSGLYNLNIVVGDPIISNPLKINLFNLDIHFSNSYSLKKQFDDKTYQAKPEIVHIFKKPEKTPPIIVSSTFTFLCLVPILLLFIIWLKIGINFKNYSFNLSSLVFHTSLNLIFILYTLFFIQLNMFSLIKFLSGVLPATFISGHYLLKGLANKKNS